MTARTPEQTHALLEAAFNSRDLEAFLEVYDDDATLLIPPDGAAAHGKAEIRAAIAPQFALTDPVARIEVLQKVQSDGLALTRARWMLVGTDPGGARVELEGRGAIVSRLQADGSWRIVLDSPTVPE
jgi:uncharacterized protein (TIGR02246 family)